MAWEERPGGRYYYRKRRIGGRVVSEYVGAGELAELEARLAEIGREQAGAERRRLQEARAEARAVDRQLDQLDQYAGMMVKACALLAGYHPHKGQWRRRRK